MRATLLVLSLTAGLAITLGDGLSAQTTTAYKNREETTGATRQCYYTALGNVYARTVRVTELCPQTIEVEGVSSRLDLPGRAAGQPRSDPWSALGQGLQETAALLQAQRDAEARRVSDSVRASRLAAAAGCAPGQITWDAAYQVLTGTLVDEYRKSEEYAAAERIYTDLVQRSGAEAANRYWDTVRASMLSYVRRRWVELSPHWRD